MFQAVEYDVCEVGRVCDRSETLEQPNYSSKETFLNDLRVSLTSATVCL